MKCVGDVHLATGPQTTGPASRLAATLTALRHHTRAPSGQWTRPTQGHTSDDDSHEPGEAAQVQAVAGMPTAHSRWIC